MRRAAHSFATLALWGSGLACTTLAIRAPEISPAVAAAGLARGDDRATLERGRGMFGASCSSCHALPRIDEHAPDEWPSILDEMSRKARLDRDSTLAVAAFVQACAAAESKAR